jgi:hypothetical protein
MATLAAFVWSNHNTFTGTKIRDALKATAQDNGLAVNDGYFGYSIMKIAVANVYLTINGCNGKVTPPPTDGDISLTSNGYYSKGRIRLFCHGLMLQRVV